MVDLFSAAKEKDLGLLQRKVLLEEANQGIGKGRQAVAFLVVSFDHN
jgi:hypothetical protein